MKKLAKLAGVMPFAHLLGVKAARAESDEDDDKKKDDDTAAKAEGDDDEDEAKAEGGDDKTTDDDKKDEEKSRKAKSKAEGDDSDDKDDDERKDEASASARSERARCALIVAHGIKTGAVRQACAYAFDTDMSASVAIATLDATASDRKGASNLASRMAQESAPRVRAEASSGAEAGTPNATVQAILAAGRKARGEA